MGPNGAGKTSLLRIMHGLDRPTTGQVHYAIPKKQAFKQQAYVFQTPVIMRRTVLENIAYPLTVRKWKKTDIRARALDWAQRVGLSDLVDIDAVSLSGGEKQKLAVARAMIIDPVILFLDEPTANLDGASTYAIEALLKTVMEEGTRVVMSTHDTGQAKRLADEVLFIHHGKIHEQSVGESFFDGPKTNEATSFLKGDILI
jgi:tungstate transport system ATP-binding protein